MNIDHEYFMREALKEAAKARNQGDIPTGAVIVRDGKIVARGYNEVATKFDIVAHAETGTIRKYVMETRQLNPGFQADSGPLKGCTLYVTCEPCPMCLWATCISGISTLVVGARHAEVGIPFGKYTIEKLIELTERKIKVVTGILSEECIKMRRSIGYIGPR
ncbi:MAG: nucleoside deaminase [Thermodesulfobacteriota bacterium]